MLAFIWHQSLVPFFLSRGGRVKYVEVTLYDIACIFPKVDPCIGPKMVPVFFSKIRESFSSK